MKFGETIETPPFIDIHVHFREPSPINTSETFAQGTLAARESGILVSADMPNNPGTETWTRDRFDDKVYRVDRGANGLVMLHAGGQPESENGAQLELMAPDAAALKLYGGKTTNNNREYVAEDFREKVAKWDEVAKDSPIIFHPGKKNLEEMIQLVAGEYKHHIHIAHVNSPKQVWLIKRYKEKGYPITCGVTPHHLLMDAHDRITMGKFAEMMPPLADQSEAEQLMVMLANGNIDIIETDYAPHSFESKMNAEIHGEDCFGETGIEHVVPQLLYQVQQGRLSLERLIDAFSTKPAQLLGITLDPKLKVVWDSELRVIGEDSVKSGAGWSPYIGNLAVGKVIAFPVIAKRRNFVRRGEYIKAA